MTTDALRALRSETYFSLTTFKRDGGGVATPVWFAEHEGAFYVFTDGTSFKVKRVRRDPRATVAACNVRGTVRGPAYDARASILPPGPERDAAYVALRRKYGIQMRLLDIASTIGRRIGRREVLRIDV